MSPHMVLGSLALLLPPVAAAWFASAHTPCVCHTARAHAARFGPPTAVSERHNQAYKETIKQFDPLPADAPLNYVELESHVPGPRDGIAEDHLVHTTTKPLLTNEECDLVIHEVCILLPRPSSS